MPIIISQKADALYSDILFYLANNQKHKDFNFFNFFSFFMQNEKIFIAIQILCFLHVYTCCLPVSPGADE